MQDIDLPDLLVFPDKYELAWRGTTDEDGAPYRKDKEERVPVYDFVDAQSALDGDHSTDAHCAMYAVEGQTCAPRIAKKAVREDVIDPVLRWVFVDVDAPDHKGDAPLENAPIGWIEQIIDAEDTIPELSHCLRWSSTGGYKYAWPLADDRQYHVQKGEDYLQQFLKYLKAGGLDVDMACKDWTRVMRLPRTVRDGQFQDYEVQGWDSLEPLDWEPPRKPEANKNKKSTTTRISASSSSSYTNEDSPDVDPPPPPAMEVILDVIDANCGYEKWARIGFILKTYYNEDTGFQLWRDWSKQADDPHDDLRGKWAQLAGDDYDGGATVGTIIHHAQQALDMSVEEAREVCDAAYSKEEMLDNETLLACAVLKREDTNGYLDVRDTVKHQVRGLPVNTWESEVVDRVKEIKTINTIAGAAFRAKEREEKKASGELISNFDVDEIVANGEPKRIKTYIGLDEICDQVFSATGDWPRATPHKLFVKGVEHGQIGTDRDVEYIESASDLGAYLQSECDVSWTDQAVSKDGDPVRSPTYSELMSALRVRTPHYYTKIEQIPHEPKIDGMYYTTTIDTGDGSTLDEFVELFNPKTGYDQKFIRSAIVTPFWGGTLNGSPAITVTSEYGRGSGKSAFVETISRLYGGMIDISADSDDFDWSEVMQRVLTDEAMKYRIARIDNIKGKVDAGQLESMITARQLSGKKMYHGDATVPNVYTWFLTVNTPEYSTDLAERSMVIELGKPDYSFPFDEKVDEFINHHRRALLEDIKAELKAPKTPVDETTRFAMWERDVLGIHDNPNELIGEIKRRRGHVDAEGDEAREALQIIEDMVAEKFGDPDRVWTQVPRSEVADAYEDHWRVHSVSGQKLASHLKPLLKHDILRDRVKWKEKRTFQYRGLEWVGRDIDKTEDDLVEWPAGNSGPATVIQKSG